jgi:hypothetical protein
MTNQTSVADTAATQILAHEILYDIGVLASREMVSRISARLEEAVDQAVRGERERCAAVCKKRAALWSNTSMASSPLGRDESRARANEATYIADAIRALSANSSNAR